MPQHEKGLRQSSTGTYHELCHTPLNGRNTKKALHQNSTSRMKSSSPFPETDFISLGTVPVFREKFKLEVAFGFPRSMLA
jgi:hypothetical protein